jgi:ABC-type transport system substrate-binding protein
MMQARKTSVKREFQLAMAAIAVIAGGLCFGGMKVQALADANSESANSLKVLLCGDGKVVFSEECGVQSLETVLAAVLGQLVYSSGSFDLRPGLLSKFNWDFDKKWYVLELRDGLKFHNGRVATSEDLEFSLLRGLLSKKGSWFKSFFANIQGIAAAEGKTSFHSGMVSLARSYFSLVPKEALKEDLTTWKTYPVGAGSFKIVSWSSNGSTVELERVESAGAGPRHVTISSKSGMTDADITVGMPLKESALTDESTSVANSVTGIYFNFENELGTDIGFRKAISFAIARKPLTAEVTAYTPNVELLASQFWGRSNVDERQNVKRAKDELSKIKSKLQKGRLRIPVFNSEFGNGKFGRYLAVLRSQLNAVGLKVEFYKSEKKFFDESDRATPFRIISLGADVADPVVLFGLFRSGIPMTPHYPHNDVRYEELYSRAAHAESLDTKVIAVTQLSNYFLERVYAVPLFERRGTVGVNKSRIKSLGLQEGSLALYLDRVVLR